MKLLFRRMLRDYTPLCPSIGQLVSLSFCLPVCQSICLSVRQIFTILMIFIFLPHCSCPNMDPAHPHATWVAVYPALLLSKEIRENLRGTNTCYWQTNQWMERTGPTARQLSASYYHYSTTHIITFGKEQWCEKELTDLHTAGMFWIESQPGERKAHFIHYTYYLMYFTQCTILLRLTTLNVCFTQWIVTKEQNIE